MATIYHSDMAAARYRVVIEETGQSEDYPVEGYVETLPDAYEGCDGMCTYGCGADPWEITGDSYGEWMTESEAWETLRDELPGDVCQIILPVSDHGRILPGIATDDPWQPEAMRTCMGIGTVDARYAIIRDSAVSHLVPVDLMGDSIWCKPCERKARTNDLRFMILANTRELEAMGETL